VKTTYSDDKVGIIAEGEKHPHLAFNSNKENTRVEEGGKEIQALLIKFDRTSKINLDEDYGNIIRRKCQLEHAENRDIPRDLNNHPQRQTHQCWFPPAQLRHWPNDALFHDPYAHLLAGERGTEIVRSIRPAKSNSWSVVVRTRILDEIVIRAIEQHNCDTIVNLAAGLDTRPYRLTLPPALRWIEVDLPPILNYKQEKLANEKPKCLYEVVKMDLADREARQALFERINGESQKVLVITEGFLQYLTREQVNTLAKDISDQSHFRFWFTEFMTPDLLKRFQKRWDKYFAGSGARMQFALDDCEAFYQGYGWQIAEFHSTLEEAHHLKREMPYAWLRRSIVRLSSKKRQEHFRRMSSFNLLERI
jgi:methyltransferase (TIGR00027 family)